MPELSVPDPVVAERQRAADILALCTRHQLDATPLIASGATVEQARAQVLDTLAARDREGTAARLPSMTMWQGSEAGIESRIALMSEGLAARHGGPAPSEQARPYARLRALDCARELLELRGIATTRMNMNDIVTRALATSDLPNLLTASGNRSLRQAYEAAPPGLRQCCRQSTAPDFRAKSALALGELPTLKKVNEHGEYTLGSVTEMKSTYSLATYGRILALTRQAIVNDDLGAFNDLLVRFGRAAAEFENGQLCTLLTSNPTMTDDSTAMFHANHGNLAGSGGAISDTTLGAGKLAMRKQTGVDKSTILNIEPKYLVVPAALEVVAQKYVTLITANAATSVNPFAGALQVVVDPRLDAGSATAWYLAADPTQVDGLEYAYLESAQGVQLQSRPGWEVDGLELKATLDFGCGAIDWRSWYKNAGA